MCKSISLILLFLVSLSSHSQGKFADKHLIKTNGQVIKYKRSVEKSDHIILRDKNSPSAAEVIIDIDEVLGYYLSDQIIRYKIQVKLPDDSTNYEFAERLLEGEIEVFQKTMGSMSADGLGNTYNTSSQYLYAKIGSEYLPIYPLQRKHKDYIITKLTDFISDDAYILEKIKNKKFRFSYNNILEVIEEYNLRAHSPVNFINDTDSSNVILYRMGRGQTKNPITIKIENQKYSLLPDDFARIYIPTDQAVKICFSDSENQKCTLIQGSDYFNVVFELIQMRSNGILRLKKKEKLTPYVIESIEKSQKRRAKKILKG